MCDIILMFTVAQKIVQLFQQEVFETIFICKKSQRLSNIYSERWKKPFLVQKNRFKFRKITRKNMSCRQKSYCNAYLRKTADYINKP